MPRKKETFVLVSLQEDQAKKLAQVVSNDTCRKILDYLGENEATESELAKKLKVPISTIHYNLQALQKGNLVEAEEFHYSEKGKEILHYRLANKYIIIAPKSTFGLKEKLRSILPVGAIALGGAAILQVFQKFIPYNVKESMIAPAAEPVLSKSIATGAVEEAAPMAAETVVEEATAEAVFEMLPSAGVDIDGASEIVLEVADAAAEGVNQTIEKTVETAPQIVEIIKEPSIWHSPALWFLIGAISALGLYLLISYIRRKK